jgi:hypothetical protein
MQISEGKGPDGAGKAGLPPPPFKKVLRAEALSEAEARLTAQISALAARVASLERMKSTKTKRPSGAGRGKVRTAE